jgi:hypothetical protein
VMLRLSLDRLLENNRLLLEAASQGLGVSASR